MKPSYLKKKKSIGYSSQEGLLLVVTMVALTEKV